MNKIPLVIWVVAAQILIILIFILLMGSHRLFVAQLEKVRRKRRELLKNYLFSLIEQNHLPKMQVYPGKPSWRKELVQELEGFDQKISSEFFNKIKIDLIQTYLLRFARKFIKSFSWKKRHLAARIFALSPMQEDEAFILYLMNDPEFPIKSTASLAAARLGSEQGIHKILYALVHEEGYSHFFYQDLLLFYPHSVFERLLEFAKDPDLRLGCLEVFAKISWPKPIPFLQEDLHSDKLTRRRLAFQVLRYNETENKQDYLKQGLKETDPEILKACLVAVEFMPIDPFIEEIQKLLLSPSWPIKIEAAKLALKVKDHPSFKMPQDESVQKAFQYVEVFK